MTSTLTVDDLKFEVRQSARRKALELIVDRGGELVIASPIGLDAATLEAFVREKRFWVYTKLAEKEALRHAVPTKDFVNGEGFLYLGRSYRLLIVGEQDVALKLNGGRFRLLQAEINQGRRHFIDWYSAHARPWLEPRVDLWARMMNVEPKDIEVRDLGFRWGSCGKGGRLNFHWATILLPASIVEYVIVHELAHLIEPNHTPGFWLRVERALPDYQERKRWLAEHGGRHVAL